MKRSLMVACAIAAQGCRGSEPAIAKASDAPADAACPTRWTTPPSTADAGFTTEAGLGAVLFRASATGTQDYACQAVAPADAGPDAAAGGGDAAVAYAWTFVGPEASLADCNGATIGTHRASAEGPTRPAWISSADGSTVVAKKLMAYPADPTAVPWLLLQATAHTGTGLMTPVQTIERVNTVGGVAPKDACDATHAGATQKVPYTADYVFFAAP